MHSHTRMCDGHLEKWHIPRIIANQVSVLPIATTNHGASGRHWTVLVKSSESRLTTFGFSGGESIMRLGGLMHAAEGSGTEVRSADQSA